MWELTIVFNEETYTATYNSQTGYYELSLEAPVTGGIYIADVSFVDIWGNTITDSIPIQVVVKQPIKVETNKVFMWIFDYYDFHVKDIVEIADYELNIDEETNANSTINVLKKTTAKSRDIVAVKKNNEVVYWGVIEEIQNEDGQLLCQYITKYITNLFDRNIQLKNENTIRTTGVEDFIGDTITDEYISNSDTFINLPWLELSILSHTPKQTSVSNVDNGIYNLHTWITNCTQNYNIVYNFAIINKKLVMSIKNMVYDKELIDTLAQSISQYSEVFETNVVSKVVVLYDKVNEQESPGIYTLYLKTDRTTTTNPNDPDRADGRVDTIYTENFEDANQEALNVMKSNTYNHNITFNIYDKYIKIGTPIAIKTKDSIIYDTYISAVKITKALFYEYVCGNIRVKFIDKLLKERGN